MGRSAHPARLEASPESGYSWKPYKQKLGGAETMSSTSAIVNKALRRIVSPVLREAGFDKVDARNAWAWKTDCIWVYKARAVGSYFSDVTGWSPGSLSIELGIHFSFMPTQSQLRKDKRSNLFLPAEYQCHLRSSLKRPLRQKTKVVRLTNPAEQERLDLWWVNRDGSNSEEVAADIAECLPLHAFDWLEEYSELQNALTLVRSEHNCYIKYARAAWLARKLGYHEEHQHFENLAISEAKRIGQDECGHLVSVPFA